MHICCRSASTEADLQQYCSGFEAQLKQSVCPGAELQQIRLVGGITGDMPFSDRWSYDVSLAYDRSTGFVAQKIKSIAIENDIPTVENKPLARTMFKSTEIGDFIPADLYRAVAEILAYVFRLQGKA